MTYHRDGLTTTAKPSRPARGTHYHQLVQGSNRDRLSRIIVSFRPDDFKIIAAEAFERDLSMSAYIRELITIARNYNISKS